jgi:hypothetical protein
MVSRLTGGQELSGFDSRWPEDGRRKTMRKILASLVLAFALLAFSPVEAQVPVFKCYASSNSAFGYGWAATPQAACVIALRECAVNTPVGDACYARWWVREQ